ncbi:MAG: hypothetical protein ACJ75J_01985, partial [Cytophagaceae bacterium]
SVALSGKVKNPALWKLAAAHLSFMAGKYRTAENLIDQVRNEKSVNPAMKFQIALTDAMIVFYSDSVIDDQSEAKIFERIQELLTYKNRIAKFDQLYSHFLLALSKKYEMAGNIEKAGLLQSKHDIAMRYNYNKGCDYAYSYFYYLDDHARPQDVKNIVSLIDRKNKTPYEKFLTDSVMRHRERLLDLCGTLYLREDLLEQAYGAYSQIPDSFWITDQYSYKIYLNSNPFYTDYMPNDMHTKRVGDTICYNKTEFVRKLIEIKRKADSGKDRGKYYFLLGNAYYNMSYYGNSWMMTKYWWSGGEDYELKRSKSNDVYYGCEKSKRYYLKAMEYSGNKALAALSCRMAGKCEMHLMTYADKNVRDDAGNAYHSNKYYRMIGKEYSEYSEELLEECFSSKDFLGKYQVNF